MDTPDSEERAPEALRALRALIVDDEEAARALLRADLASHPEIEVVGECANGFEAVKAAAELQPDLLLLDVEMPKLSGLEVLELIGEGPAVIFVTGYDQYAIQAFEVHAVDYLLKPYTPERLAEALRRAAQRLARGERPLPGIPGALARTVREERGRPWIDRILVRDGANIRVIPADRLDYAEARDDTVLLVAEGGKHLKPQTLNDLETQLDPARFVRIHRSYLLNVERLERLELYAKDSRVAILRGGARLPVSRAGYARLRELL
jgi:two-component system, LytTR family, response regulator